MNQEDASSIYLSALTDYRNGFADEAITKLQSIVEAFPKLEDAHEALSVIFYNQKKYDDAVAISQKWVDLDPHSIMARTNLSRCYAAKGMILEAEREQNESRRLTWKEELKAKKSAAPKANYEEQIKRYKEVINYDPSDVLGYFSLGNVYLEMESWRDAADTFEKAVSVAPEHSASYLGLGTALEKLGDKQKCLKYLNLGIGVADKHGDMLAQKKMEALLNKIK